MSVVLVTGCSGLIGSETCRFFHEKGFEVVGIDNNLRKYFFGEDGSTDWNTGELKRTLRNFTHFAINIRDQEAVSSSSAATARASRASSTARRNRVTTGRRADHLDHALRHKSVGTVQA